MEAVMDCNAGTENFSARVRHTLDDLAAIRQTLLGISDSPANPHVAPDQVLDLELAGELKSVVDALRLLLWAYVNALSTKSGRAPAEVLSWYKMQLAVEMLRSVGGQAAPAKEGCISDFERMVSNAMSAAGKAPISLRTQ
jgi:hypothetical protein